MTTNDEIQQRFFTAQDGKPATEQQKYSVRRIRDETITLARIIEVHVPAGRNKAIALTALEDVLMRANRGIFADQVPDATVAA